MFLTAISFPDLGIMVDPSRVAFNILGKDIYWYGIIIAAGFLLAVVYSCKRAPQVGVTSDEIIDMLIFAVPSAIIGARAYYCLFNWQEFTAAPIRVFYVWEGGLAIYGGIIGAVIAALIFLKLRGVKPGAMFDLGGLGLMIGQGIGRWGNFMNREAYGGVYDGFLKMGLYDAAGKVTYYHPAFLYESLWNALGFVILHFFSKRFRKFDGEIFLLYVAWYGLGRGFIEGIRTDSLYFFGTGLRVSQALGFASCLVALGLLAYHLIFKEYTPDELLVNVRRAEAATKISINETTDKQENEEDNT